MSYLCRISPFLPLSVEITSSLSFRVKRLTSPLSPSVARSPRQAISRGGQIKICIKTLRDYLWHVGEREMARDCRLQDFLISHRFLGLSIWFAISLVAFLVQGYQACWTPPKSRGGNSPENRGKLELNEWAEKRGNKWGDLPQRAPSLLLQGQHESKIPKWKHETTTANFPVLILLYHLPQWRKNELSIPERVTLSAAQYSSTYSVAQRRIKYGISFSIWIENTKFRREGFVKQCFRLMLCAAPKT